MRSSETSIKHQLAPDFLTKGIRCDDRLFTLQANNIVPARSNCLSFTRDNHHHLRLHGKSTTVKQLDLDPCLDQDPHSASVPKTFSCPLFWHLLYNYKDLELATDRFSELSILGRGVFGPVYRGTLSGKEVVIKKYKSGGSLGDREFRAVVEIISRVHHRNLVSLVGYCIHEDQRLFIYEYVPNKTLEFHLHGSGRPTLDWHRRWKIALGSDKGLAYLHEDCDPKIIHRNIKAANILLDYNFEPKVADFLLAKFVRANVSLENTPVMGTSGYVAPEYATSGKLSVKSDVYSYGVMLLELITGRKPIDFLMDGILLVNWARPLLLRAVTEGIYDELVDPRLKTIYDPCDMTRVVHCAAAAVQHSAKKRPQMSQIVRYLEREISQEDLNAGMIPEYRETLLKIL